VPAAVIIDGKKIADEEALKLSAKVKLLESKHNVIPGLAVVLVGNDPASHIYVASKVRRAKEVGISIFQHLLPENVTQNEVLDLIERLNKDSAVNGILVQLPLPEHLTQNIIIDSINPDKDVDGFTVYNVGRLNTWQDCLEPSTPQGALILIKSVLGDDLSGKKAVVLGRSLIVGRPMASILGGVGPMTVICMLMNTIKSCLKQNNIVL